MAMHIRVERCIAMHSCVYVSIDMYTAPYVYAYIGLSQTTM